MLAGCGIAIGLGVSGMAAGYAQASSRTLQHPAPFAQVAASGAVFPSASLAVGTRGIVSAQLPEARPRTTPCVVSLFNRESFGRPGDAASMAARPHPFEFAWPQSCGVSKLGPWSKIVLEADFSVPAGRQYDRTASLWLDGVNLYFGTTMEPQPDLAEHWHVERDLTDYGALFRRALDGPLRGQMILNNQLSPETNQPIFVSVRLLFYPVARGARTPVVPDRIYALSASALGEPTELKTSQDELARSILFPRNVERAYLDVIAQSQLVDERWYTCVEQKYLRQTRPYSLEAFEACDGGSLREVEVLVDGRPAGLAPVYPWIFAGGLAPHLWLPTPALGTLNFIPSRMDLTPFAGLFDDGHAHRIAVRVLGANNFFNVAANLVIAQDHAQTVLHGSLLEDTLLAAEPTGLRVAAHLYGGPLGATVGTINTSIRQNYRLRGVLDTRQGKLFSTVATAVRFVNQKRFWQSAPRDYTEQIDQQSVIVSTIHRQLGPRTLSRFSVVQSAPFSMIARKSFSPGADRLSQNFTAEVIVRQGRNLRLQGLLAPGESYRAHLAEALVARDRANGPTISPPLNRTNFDHQEQGRAAVSFHDSLGSCVQLALQSRAEHLVAVERGLGCAGRRNLLREQSRPTSPWLMPLIP